MDTICGLIFLVQWIKDRKWWYFSEACLFTLQSFIHLVFFDNYIQMTNYQYDEALSITFLGQNIILWIAQAFTYEL